MQASVQAVETRTVSTAAAAPALARNGKRRAHHDPYCRRGPLRSSGWPSASASSQRSRWVGSCPMTSSGSSPPGNGCSPTIPSSGWTHSATQSHIAAGSPTNGDPRSSWPSCSASLARPPPTSTPSSWAGLCLLSRARPTPRALGARGGRVAAIVLLLAVGIAGVVAGDRGLDFSLVWLPLELLVLTRARTDPRWLLVLPVLCVAWVNTHGSILMGLVVLGVELAWALAPGRVVEHLGGVRQSPLRGPARADPAWQRDRLLHHSLRPGPPGLRPRGGAQPPARPVHRRVELA